MGPEFLANSYTSVKTLCIGITPMVMPSVTLPSCGLLSLHLFYCIALHVSICV